MCVLPPPNCVISDSTGAVFGRLAIQPAQHHAAMVNQRLGEIIPAQKILPVRHNRGRGARCDLFQMDGELAGVERPAFAQFLPGNNYFIPGFHMMSIIAGPSRRPCKVAPYRNHWTSLFDHFSE